MVHTVRTDIMTAQDKSDEWRDANQHCPRSHAATGEQRKLLRVTSIADWTSGHEPRNKNTYVKYSEEGE